MTLSRDLDAQGGLESVSKAERVASLTGIRAVAALAGGGHPRRLHDRQVHPRLRRAWSYSRMEIGVPDLLRAVRVSAVRAVGQGRGHRTVPAPSVRRYAWHRVRRIMPAYVVTVLVAYALYHFRTAGPNPGHTWMGLLRNLTLTQIYTDNYLYFLRICTKALPRCGAWRWRSRSTWCCRCWPTCCWWCCADGAGGRGCC